MLERPWLTTPVAILIGSGVIAGAAYLGLRERGAASTPPASPAGSVAASSGSSADVLPSGTMPAHAPTAAPAARQATSEEAMTRALAFLAKHRGALVDACWRPSVAKKAEPARVGLVLDLTVSATGTQIARGILEERGAARADVTTCVQDTLPPFELGDVGASQHLEVPLQFP